MMETEALVVVKQHQMRFPISVKKVKPHTKQDSLVKDTSLAKHSSPTCQALSASTTQTSAAVLSESRHSTGTAWSVS